MMIVCILIFLGILMFLCGAHFIKETTIPDLEMLGVLLCIFGFSLTLLALGSVLALAVF